MIQQRDGKLVAAGVSSGSFVLVRYDAAGSLDGTFGSGGRVTTRTSGGAYALVQQVDGKLVAAGHSAGTGRAGEFALVRYNTDGSLDGTFGGGGRVATPIGRTSDQAFALVPQAGGKLVAAGFSWGDPPVFALVRYNADGSLDGTFGRGGTVTTPSGNLGAHGLVQQADGKLVAAGDAWVGDGHAFGFRLVRYDTDGRLDGTFGRDGKVTTSLGASDFAMALVQQTDGKLVAAGCSYSGGTNKFALVRYNADGSLDSTFGGGGKVTTAIGGSNDIAYALIQQTDGKLVAAGAAFVPGDSTEFRGPFGSIERWFAGSVSRGTTDFALVRYNADGSLDGTFGTGGKVTMPIGSGNDQANALIQQADGKLVAAGESRNGNVVEFALARFEN